MADHTYLRGPEDASALSLDDSGGFLVTLSEEEAALLDLGTFDVVDMEDDVFDELTQPVEAGVEARVEADDINRQKTKISTRKSGKRKSQTANEWRHKVSKNIEQLQSYDDMVDFVESSKNANTARKTRQVVNAFQKWLSKVCMEEAPIETMGAKDLDGFLSNYIMMKRKVDGTEHEPDTLTSIHRGILRHLRDQKYPHDPLIDAEFEMSREILAAKRIKLKQMGKGNRPNKAEAIDDAEMESLWTTGALGMGSPRTLQETIFFFFNMGFGSRGSDEAENMMWGDVEEHKEADGTRYLEFTERATKTRNGCAGSDPRAFPPKIYETGGDRCPLMYFDVYKAKRHAEMCEFFSEFYLTVHPVNTMADKIGYSCAPMGINKLNEVVKTVCKEAGVPGKKTNHSLRKTTVTQLMANNVPPVLVAQHSGHKNLASLNAYSTATRMQQRAMSNIISGSRERLCNPPAALGAPPGGQGAPPAALGAPPTVLNPPSAIDRPSSCGFTPSSDSVKQSVVPRGGESGVNTTIERLAHSASGMFANANIHGSINVTINYNVSNQSSSSINVSPVIPKVLDA